MNAISVVASRYPRKKLINPFTREEVKFLRNNPMGYLEFQRYVTNVPFDDPFTKTKAAVVFFLNGFRGNKWLLYCGLLRKYQSISDAIGILKKDPTAMTHARDSIMGYIDRLNIGESFTANEMYAELPDYSRETLRHWLRRVVIAIELHAEIRTIKSISASGRRASSRQYLYTKVKEVNWDIDWDEIKCQFKK